MIKGKDIVIVGMQSWDISIGSNCKNIAAVLAQHNRVIYVNVPLDRKKFLKRRFTDPNDLRRLSVLKGRSSGLVDLGNAFWSFYPKMVFESANWIKNKKVYDYFNRLNTKRLASEIRRIAQELGFSDYILFNDSSMFRGVYLKELLEPALNIYYIRDNLITQDYFKRHGVRLEPETMRSADLVVSNSPYLRDYAKPYNRHAYYVGQGCDLELFSQNGVQEPQDLATIHGVKIGYIGFLTEMRLDIELLVELAKARADWQLVLVGPEDGAFKRSALHHLPNVHFLGSKNVDELPAYIKYFDVCMNPQLVNDLTIGNYPRKIDEYLAMGKPTVATQTPTMEIFKDHVYLGETATDYIQLIERALEENSEDREQRRMAFAQGHTWENNVLEIGRAIERAKQEKAS
ncbi:glycosyltransferase [Maribacter sp. 2307ULW6-5]|uniref:glycosyltransferase n=1 Tax=Maribacter sp. 2307ULW6-5 TaxID=3386275 RepID=UPI0039BCA144